MRPTTTIDALTRDLEPFQDAESFVFDVETMGEHRGDPQRNSVVWLSMATSGHTVVIPFGHPNGQFKERVFPVLPSGNVSKDVRKSSVVWTDPPEQLRFHEARHLLEPLFFSDKTKVGHNVKFDLESIAKHFGGAVPPPPYFCTQIAAFVVDSRHKGFLSLDRCCKRELGYEMVKGVGRRIEDHSFDDVARYSWLDARYDWLLYLEYREQLRQNGLDDVFNLEMDVLQVVVDMEMTGAPINIDTLQQVDAYLSDEITQAEASVYREAGRAFNINSNHELQRVLYTKKADGGQGLRQKVLTEGGKKKQELDKDLDITDYSVAEKALAKFSANTLVDSLLRYNKLKTLHSTFVMPYLGGEVTRTTKGKSRTETKQSLLHKGRIHARFNQIGTDTGRFSSSAPNLQNVPARSEDGKRIRSAFCAPDGYLLVVADYSQIEPRIIADLSGDKHLLAVYEKGEDIYTALAEPFGLGRDAGKTLVLAVSYGVGPDKVAANLGISLKDAKQLIYDDFPAQFPSINRLKSRVVRSARAKNPHYVETLHGFRRYLPDLSSRVNKLRSRAERQAFNTVIQGTAAYVNKAGLVEMYRNLPPGTHPILTVHDEVVVLAPESVAAETAVIVSKSLESVNPLSLVPLVAEAKICRTWAEGK